MHYFRYDEINKGKRERMDQLINKLTLEDAEQRKNL